jgi:hypothetical protein
MTSAAWEVIARNLGLILRAKNGWERTLLHAGSTEACGLEGSRPWLGGDGGHKAVGPQWGLSERNA